MNTANERSLNSARASSPRTSRTLNGAGRGTGRCVRQHKRIEAEQDRCSGGDPHRDRGRLYAELPHDQSGHDPADRPQHPHRGELSRRVGQVMKGDGIRERERRHVAARRRRSAPDRNARKLSSVDAQYSTIAPARWSPARSRSVEKNRSAIIPMKNGEIIAAIAVLPYARPTWVPSN